MISLSQLALVASESNIWQAIAEALGTVLLGILAFIGRLLLKKVTGLDTKLERALERLNDWNQSFQITMTDHETRLWNLDGKQPERRISGRDLRRD
jgi:hypothetical protein